MPPKPPLGCDGALSPELDGGGTNGLRVVGSGGPFESPKRINVIQNIQHKHKNIKANKKNRQDDTRRYTKQKINKNKRQLNS